MAKYAVLFSFTGETAKRFVAQPSDRAAAVRGLVESAGGSMESYYWMFGQYDGLVIFELPDSQTAAALSLVVTGSGAFTTFETHELIRGRRSCPDRRAGETDQLPAARHLTRAAGIAAETLTFCPALPRPAARPPAANDHAQGGHACRPRRGVVR